MKTKKVSDLTLTAANNGIIVIKDLPDEEFTKHIQQRSTFVFTRFSELNDFIMDHFTNAPPASLTGDRK